MNPFNVIEPVEYLKGTVGSKPFKNHFTGWKNRADCDGADAAYSAYVLVPHQMKYAHHGVLFFSGAPAGFVSDHSLSTFGDLPLLDTRNLGLLAWRHTSIILHLLVRSRLAKSGKPTQLRNKFLSVRISAGDSPRERVGWAGWALALSRSSPSPAPI